MSQYIAIVEDEELSRNRLVSFVNRIGMIGVGFENGPPFLDWIARGNKPFGLFLDLELPGMHGLEVAQEIAFFGLKIPIIITSAHDINASNAYKHKFIDYILKPFLPEYIEKAIQAFKDFHGHQQAQTLKRIPVKIGQGTILLDVSKVIYFETLEGIIYAHSEGKKFETDFNSLEEIEIKLPKFIRIDRPVLVNPNLILGYREISSGRVMVDLPFGIELKASRRRSGLIHDFSKGLY